MNTIKDKIRRFIENVELRQKVSTGIQLLIIIGLYMYFLSNKSLYTVVSRRITYYDERRLIFVTITTICIVAVILLKNKLGVIANKVMSILYAIVTPIFAFFAVEIVIQSDFNRMYMTNEVILINIAIIAVITLIFTVFTNSLKWGPIVTTSICIVFSIANCFIYEFRGVPILASDIATIQTAASVASNYTLQWTFEVFFGVLALYGFIMVGLKLNHTKLFKWKLRTVATILTCILSISLVNNYILSDYLDQKGIKIKMFKPMVTYRQYGNMITFARSIEYATVKKPEGYSIGKVKEIIDKYSKVESDETSKVENPNVIAIVNETFSDLSLLGKFTTNEDYMPFFHSVQDDYVGGVAYASVVGGQTANTEFEFLTNSSMAFLPSQSVVFQMYIKNEMPSLVTSLKELGYVGNAAMHMHVPNNYNRALVYPLLGFDDFIHKLNYEGKMDLVRKYSSDSANFKAIIDNYEATRQQSSEPYFMYNLTIQNHSPFDQDYDNFIKNITIDKEYADADAERFINLMSYSDTAFKELTEYFSNVDEPTAIIMFGDHQPRLSDKFINKITSNKFRSWTDEEMMARYAVPFAIWTNYEIEHEYIDMTSINYLQTILFETVGNKLTGYQKFLKELREQVPVITGAGYFGSDGVFYQLTDTTSPYYDIVSEYSILQYNDVFDKNNRFDDFFYLDKK